VISEDHGITYVKTSPAKALFDHLYLHKIPLSFHSWNESLADELRLTLDDFIESEREEFDSYIESSEIRKMKLILENLRSTEWQHYFKRCNTFPKAKTLPLGVFDRLSEIPVYLAER